jgi:hypothetical protein
MTPKNFAPICAENSHQLKMAENAADDSSEDGLGFESIALSHDWRDLPVRKLRRQADEEYVRDCPEDETYEANRQRYLANRPAPTLSRQERAMQLFQSTPGYISTGAQLVTTGAQLAGQATCAVIATTTQTYAEEGASGVARTAFDASWAVAKHVSESIYDSAYETANAWYGNAGSETLPETARIQRRSSSGQNYTLPDLQAIRQGKQKQRPLRDIAIQEEDEDGDLGGEAWEEDEDLEDMSANARARKVWRSTPDEERF